MSLEMMNDEEAVADTDADTEIGELSDLVSGYLSTAQTVPQGGIKVRQSPDARRAIEQYLEQKQLRDLIQDPLFDREYY